jgi:phage terminase large subunit-like protein
VRHGSSPVGIERFWSRFLILGCVATISVSTNVVLRPWDGGHFVLDEYAERMNYPELKRAAADLWKRFKPSKLLIEDKSWGTSLIQELKSAGIYSIEPYVPPPGSD